MGHLRTFHIEAINNGIVDGQKRSDYAYKIKTNERFRSVEHRGGISMTVDLMKKMLQNERVYQRTEFGDKLAALLE